jgi:hypothetical protein
MYKSCSLADRKPKLGFMRMLVVGKILGNPSFPHSKPAERGCEVLMNARPLPLLNRIQQL